MIDTKYNEQIELLAKELKGTLMLGSDFMDRPYYIGIKLDANLWLYFDKPYNKNMVYFELTLERDIYDYAYGIRKKYSKVGQNIDLAWTKSVKRIKAEYEKIKPLGQEARQKFEAYENKKNMAKNTLKSCIELTGKKEKDIILDYSYYFEYSSEDFNKFKVYNDNTISLDLRVTFEQFKQINKILKEKIKV